jgi:hypothetical protein
MPALTAKVFRTYNASVTLDKLVPWPLWPGISGWLLFVWSHLQTKFLEAQISEELYCLTCLLKKLLRKVSRSLSINRKNF